MAPYFPGAARMLTVPASCCCLLVLNTNGSCCLVLFPSANASRPEVCLHFPWRNLALNGEVYCVRILLCKLCSPFLIWLRPIIPIDLTKCNCDISCEYAVLNWMWERSLISSLLKKKKLRTKGAYFLTENYYLISDTNSRVSCKPLQCEDLHGSSESAPLIWCEMRTGLHVHLNKPASHSYFTSPSVSRPLCSEHSHGPNYSNILFADF